MNKLLRSVLSMSVMASLTACSVLPGSEDVRTSGAEVEVKPFATVPVSFTHQWNKDATYPYSGAAAIDVDQDGNQEIFVGGGDQQEDVLLSFDGKALINVIDGTGLSSTEATFGAVSVDIDNDSDTDMIITRNNGVFIYLNDAGVFKPQQLPVQFGKDTIPLNVALGDINRDGLVDLYISCFVAPGAFKASTFNNPEHAKANVMLLNKGQLTFEDVTRQTGTQGNANTFHSSFVDLDNNGYQDLVLAQNTGVIEIFKNQGNLTFDPVTVDSGLGYWMGLGVGDMDNDGDQDLFFSNIGNTIPQFMTRGDLRDDQVLEGDWILLRNEGHFNFSNVTKEYMLDSYGFAWGGVFEDVNLDGKLDLLVAQNYVKWPLHKLSKMSGKSFLQLGEDGESAFYQAEQLNLEDQHYGQSPLIVDINADGKPDVFWLNMSDEQQAYLNQSDNRFVKVTLPDSARYLGATVTAVTAAGKSYSRQFVANTGMMTDSSNELFFGLGREGSIEKLIVQLADGRTHTIDNPDINSNIIIDF